MGGGLNIEEKSVVDAITKYESEISAQQGQSVKWGDRVVLYRKHLEDGKIGLGCNKRKELGWWDQVRLFFGDPKFKLSTVSGIINQIVSDKKPIPVNDSLEFTAGVIRINQKIRSYIKNYQSSFLFRLFREPASEITLPQPSQVPSSPPSSSAILGKPSLAPPLSQPPLSPTSLSPKKTQQPSASTQTLSSTQPSTSTPPSGGSGKVASPTPHKASENLAMTLPCDPTKASGIPNPSCHCFFNATLKALWASSAFRTKLEAWARKYPGGQSELLQHIFEDISQNKTIRQSEMFAEKSGVVEPKSNANKKYSSTVSTLSCGKAPTILEDLKIKLIELKPTIQGFIGQYPELRQSLGQVDVLDGIRDIDKERDAQELLVALLVAVFLADKPDFPTVVGIEHIERERSDIALGKKSPEKGGEQTPELKDVYIPTLDSPKLPISDFMAHVKIPDGVDLFETQKYFTGYEERDEVDVRNVVNNQNNHESFFGLKQLNEVTSADKNRAIEDCRKKWGQNLKPSENPLTNVTRRYPLIAQSSKDAPPFLPIHVGRFKNVKKLNAQGKEEAELIKDRTPVTSPYVLEVPVETNDGKQAGTVKYVLKAAVVHFGSSISGGHYVTYVPDPTSAVRDPKTGKILDPTKWTRHSDSSVTEVSKEEAISNMAFDSYILMYDRLEPPVESQ